jgi:hypothetical protein
MYHRIFLLNKGNNQITELRTILASVHASYDNISHLFPLLLIGHVVIYIVLIKDVILVSLENASFHVVYTINWFKKCSILITVLTLSDPLYHGKKQHWNMTK